MADVIAELEAEMLEAARKLQFEKAANLRDQLSSANGRRCDGTVAAAGRQSQRSASLSTIKRGCHASAKRLGLVPSALRLAERLMTSGPVQTR